MKQNLKYWGTLQTGGGCMNHYFSVNNEALMVAEDHACTFGVGFLTDWMDADAQEAPTTTETVDTLDDGTAIVTFHGWTITFPMNDSIVEIINRDGDMAARFRVDPSTGHTIPCPITVEEPMK